MLIFFITPIITMIIVLVLAQTVPLRISKLAGAICFLVFLAIILAMRAQLITRSIPDLVQSGINLLIIVFVPIISLMISIKNVRIKILIYLSFLAVGLVLLPSSLLYWLLTIVMPTTIFSEIVDLIMLSVILAFCIITYKNGIIGRLFRNIIHIKDFQKVLLLGSIWLSLLMAYMMSTLHIEFPNLPGFVLAGTLNAVLITLMALIILIMIVSSLSSAYYRNLSGIMDKQVRTQAAYYETMLALNEDIKRFQHDYKNLRLGIINYLMRYDIDGALKYLEEDEMSPGELGRGYETGSILLDALLSEKHMRAASVNASVDFHGYLPGAALKSTDICVIFGNALDNAIEECAKFPEEKKVISVKSAYAKGFLFIKFENPVASAIVIENNAISTSKEKKNIHGIGLQSIKASIRKYGGDMTLSCEDGIFSLEIDLEIDEPEDG